MTAKKTVLILGASYGTLLATKLALAGHDATLVCLPAEAEAINAGGTRVRIPVRGREGKIEVASSALPGRIAATTPDAADPAAFDLVALAMQEPQYRAPEIRALLGRVEAAGKPMMSIMNMPPLPYLARLPGVDVATIRNASADASVWGGISPSRMTLASPDPQAFRPDPQDPTLLEVSLPTNFKVAAFEDPAHTAILEALAADIEAARFEHEGEAIALPVKLKVHASLYVPLAKWAMLLTGNYRCVQDDTVIPIREAVHADPAASREVYEWVCRLCVEMGAAPEDMVPFEKYANAAQGLAKPSSAARALAAGAPAIERVDALVQALGRARGMSHPSVDRTVARVDAWLERNRAKAG
ncbi:hypothetical protein LNKW23_30920 [Paralimibaculum aggregatum]|uniref:Ketopantoate reductase n=1 Tax=Paralimibaculum aggregatum TaxID=3036245 RepID=A0ABQ6LQM2_9RHOB|nr:hypothetical protein [Limibaculum sp. NKW23]GMG83878.1 hypothetical protein LNKW23_30920 [Limibaculum sp. NKW23]